MKRKRKKKVDTLKRASSAMSLQVDHQTALPSLDIKNSPNPYGSIVASGGKDIFITLTRTPNNRIHIMHGMC